MCQALMEIMKPEIETAKRVEKETAKRVENELYIK